MNTLHKKISAGCMAVVMALTSLTGADTTKAENNITLHDPVIEDTVTWDCIYYGNYPQTRITEETDSDVYNTLLNSTDWDENGDITIGTEKYHRIQKKDAISTAIYIWEDANVYHYFKYEPIKWRVLDVNETEIYLVSDLALDTQPIEQMPWGPSLETCTLRSWLNGYDKTMNDSGFDYSQKGFLNRAFTQEEQEHLLVSGSDKVDLLELEEVSGSAPANYGFISDEARKSLSSDYAKAMGIFWDTTGYSRWWLFSYGDITLNALYIQVDGAVYTKGITLRSAQNGIRPAIHLKLEDEPVYRYAGTISSDGTQQIPDPTSTPIPSPTAVVTVPATATPVAATSTPMPTVTPMVSPSTVTPTEAPTTPSPVITEVPVTPSPVVTEIPVTPTTKPTKVPTISPTAIISPTTTPIATSTPVPTATSTPTATPTIKKGTIFKDKKTKAVYKVTKVATKKPGTVQYVKPTSNNVTTVTIPATIKINKKTYKVTSIANKALQKKKKLKKVVIGKNVSSIGKHAFYGSKKLKLIQIKTTKLKAKKVGKNAFKGIHKKAKIIVPAKKQKAYKKILKSAGIGKNVKVTK